MTNYWIEHCDQPRHRPNDVKWDVFISYRSLDRVWALALYDMLGYPFPNEPDASLVRAQGVLPRVCWKTGTSTGYHDAWSYAFNAQYVVGVWLGNCTGAPSRRLVGSRAALPLAAAVFRSIRASEARLGPVVRR